MATRNPKFRTHQKLSIYGGVTAPVDSTLFLTSLVSGSNGSSTQALILTNNGTGSRQWSLGATPSGLTISPSSGVLNGRSSQLITLTSNYNNTYTITLTDPQSKPISGSPVGFVVSGASGGPTLPSSVTLSASDTGTTGSTVTLTFTLDQVADQTYTITPSATNGATLGHVTRTITSGQTQTTTTVSLAADGSTSVDFTVSPSLTRAGRPKTVTFSSLAGNSNFPANTLLTGTTSPTIVSYGQPFKDGAIAPGEALSGRQINPITYWASGYVKHAIVSSSVSGATSYTDTLTIGSAVAGSDLTTSDLQTAMTQAVTISTGTFGSVSWTGSDWASPFETVATGPLMSSWVYRKQIGSDAHLVAWLEVRLYSTGAVEVFPWIENGYLTVASPDAKTDTYTLTMGGTTRFTWTGTVYHHTRLPLIDHGNGYGSVTTFSHWIGSDPAPRCAHDTRYVMMTGVLPWYGWPAPSSGTLDAKQQTYSPNTLAGDTNANGSAGGAGGVIDDTSAMYLTSAGDVRAWKAMMTHALSAGSWTAHYRDEVTNRPISYVDRPNVSLVAESTPAIPTPGGGSVTNAGRPAFSHTASYAYVPFLLTGRRWFLDELHFWTTTSYLSTNPGYRDYDDGTFYGVSDRTLAWSLNLLAQSCAATPTTHALSASMLASWAANVVKLKAVLIDGTLYPGRVNDLGIVSPESSDGAGTGYEQPPSTAWWASGFMADYPPIAIGAALDYGIPQDSTSLAAHEAVANHAFKMPVGKLNDGQSGRYNWRHFVFYRTPIGTDRFGFPPDTWYTWSDAYAELVATYGIGGQSGRRGLPAFESGTTTNMTSGTTTRGYGSVVVAGAALAAQNQASGALAAYDRITASASYPWAFQFFMQNESPRWGIKPRPPEWLNAPGTISNLGTDTLDTAAGRTTQFWRAYSGIGWAPWWGAHGSVIAAGGGHADGQYNDVYRFDLATQDWSRIKTAATPYVKSDGWNSDPSTGWMWANSTDGDFTVQTGELHADHHYSNLLCVPPDAISGTAPNGWLVKAGTISMPVNGGAGTARLCKLAMGQDNLWSHTGSGDTTSAAHGASAYDSLRQRVWYRQDGTSRTLYYKDLTGGAQGSLLFSGTSWESYSCIIEYDAVNDVLLHYIHGGDAGGVTLRVLDIATATQYQPAISGSPPGTSRFAACWSQEWNCIVVYPGMGGNTVYFLKPSGNPRSTTWTWSTQTFTGSATTLPVDGSGGDQGFNRLRHVASLGNVLIWCALGTAPVQLIHLSSVP